MGEALLTWYGVSGQNGVCVVIAHMAWRIHLEDQLSWYGWVPWNSGVDDSTVIFSLVYWGPVQELSLKQ